MANVRGITMVLKVGVTATAPVTWALLEGQTSLTFGGGADIADTTDKTNQGWSSGVLTIRNATVSVSGNLMESADRTEFNKLVAAWLASTTHHCQVIYDTAGNGWSADFYVSIDNLTGDVRDVVKYTMTLTPSEALVALTPT